MRLENFSDQPVQVVDKHLSVFSSSGSLDRLKVRSLIEQVLNLVLARKHLYMYVYMSQKKLVIAFPFKLQGAPIAQLGECRTLDCKVAGLILTQGPVLCP